MIQRVETCVVLSLLPVFSRLVHQGIHVFLAFDHTKEEINHFKIELNHVLSWGVYHHQQFTQCQEKLEQPELDCSDGGDVVAFAGKKYGFLNAPHKELRLDWNSIISKIIILSHLLARRSCQCSGLKLQEMRMQSQKIDSQTLVSTSRLDRKSYNISRKTKKSQTRRVSENDTHQTNFNLVRERVSTSGITPNQGHCKKNFINCMQLTCSMLQPSFHPNSTFCTVAELWVEEFCIYLSIHEPNRAKKKGKIGSQPSERQEIHSLVSFRVESTQHTLKEDSQLPTDLLGSLDGVERITVSKTLSFLIPNNKHCLVTALCILQPGKRLLL
ncbi:putative signal peptide protein [Puccinia sorghi]|uniref:Putative signal peptide protein n=1 Tax=Puccinia sorghi TaxID=27349 RepID=A0A0L6UMB1_9BASI|nr:putative signal peptide protein [Puccinia sorghi]